MNEIKYWLQIYGITAFNSVLIGLYIILESQMKNSCPPSAGVLAVEAISDEKMEPILIPPPVRPKIVARPAPMYFAAANIWIFKFSHLYENRFRNKVGTITY